MTRLMTRALILSVTLLAVAGAAGEADAAPHKVCLQPLGPHDRALLASVEKGIRFVYGFETAVLLARPLPKTAFYAPRKRYRAEKLLDWLDAEVLPGSG